MTVAATLAFCATALPLAILLARTLRGGGWKVVTASLAAALLCGAFLLSHPHQDDYSGIDTACYGFLADAIAVGTPLVGPDEFGAQLPRRVARALRYRPRRVEGSAEKCRPTRDCVFEVKKGHLLRPFYSPLFSLSEAGSGLRRLFMPALGTVWVALLFAVACRRGGLRGFPVAAALLLATPYPAWFFRGEFADCAAAILATAVFLSHAARPIRGTTTFALAAFALGYAASLHMTALLFAAPTAILLLADAERPRQRAACALGLVAGFTPVCYLTRHVCAPYGDWTRLSRIVKLAASGPEHLVLFVSVALLVALVAGVAFTGKDFPPRRRLADAFRTLPPWTVLVAAALPLAALAFRPIGFRYAAQSLGLPGLVVFAVGVAALARRPAGGAHRLAFVLFFWGACAMALILGAEAVANRGRVAGIWGYRRILPAVLALIAAFAAPLSGWLSARMTTPPHSENDAAPAATTPRLFARIALLALALLALAAPFTCPTAYFAVNGRGSAWLADEIRRSIDAAAPDLVVFDYFPHAIPFAWDRRRHVVGLGTHAVRKWPRVARWIGRRAKTEKVLVVSSYPMAALERRFALEPVAKIDREVSFVKSRNFRDAVQDRSTIVNTLAWATPLAGTDADNRRQEVWLGGSPIGLRGEWLNPGARKGLGGAWSRPGAGIVGPLPSPGRNVAATFDLSWFPPKGGPSNQIVRVDFPGNRYVALVKVAAGRHEISMTFVSEALLPDTGVYTIAAPKPYDPAQYGLAGYPPDLGVFVHRARFVRAARKTPPPLPENGAVRKPASPPSQGAAEIIP